MSKKKLAKLCSLLLTLMLLIQCFASPALANDNTLIDGDYNGDSNKNEYPDRPPEEYPDDGSSDNWECKEFQGPHRYEDLGFDPAPSCETDGVHVYWCPCGTYKRVTVRAPGHSTVIEPAVEPTCTEAGSTEGRYCSVCGLTMIYKKQLPAKGHSIVTDKAVAASCSKTGLTEGSHCSVCGEVLVKQNIIPTVDHTVVIDRAVAASCDSCGLTEGSHCSVCGTVLVAQKEIPAAGHTIVTDRAVAATCESSGLTEGSHCTVCKKVLVVQKEIPAAGHTIVSDKAVAVTCTKAGISEGSHCSTCGLILLEQREIPATGHTIVTDAAVEPTCTRKGLTEGKRCSVCGEILTAQDTIPARGHKLVTDAAVESTCTKQGLTEGKHCSVCDTVTQEQKAVPLAPHVYAIESIAALRQGKATCVNCSNTIALDGDSIDQLYESGFISAYDYVTIRPMSEKERLDLCIFLYFAGKLTGDQYNELTNGVIDSNIQQFYVSDYLDPNAPDHSIDTLSGEDLGEDSNIDYIISASQSTSDGGSKQSLDIQYKADSTATKSTIRMNDGQLTMEAKQGQSLPNRSQIFTVESSDGSITTVDVYENGKPVDFEDATSITKEDGSSETTLTSESGTKYTYSKDTTQPPVEDEGNDTIQKTADIYNEVNTDPVTSTATQTPTAEPSPSPTPTSPVIAEAGSGLEYDKDFYFDTGESSAQQEQEATASPSPSAVPSTSKKFVASVDTTKNDNPVAEAVKSAADALSDDANTTSHEANGNSNNLTAILDVTLEGDVTEKQKNELTFNVPGVKSGSDPKLSIIDRSSGNGKYKAIDSELIDDAELQESLSSFRSNGSLEQAHELQQGLDKQLGNEGASQSYTILGSGDNAYAIGSSASTTGATDGSSGSSTENDVENTAAATASPSPAPEASPAPTSGGTSSNNNMDDVFASTNYEALLGDGYTESRVTDDVTNVNRDRMIELLMQHAPTLPPELDPDTWDDDFGNREIASNNVDGNINNITNNILRSSTNSSFYPSANRAELLELLREGNQNTQGTSGSSGSSKSRNELAEDILAGMQANSLQQTAQSSQGSMLAAEEDNGETLILLNRVNKKTPESLWNPAS